MQQYQSFCLLQPTMAYKALTLFAVLAFLALASADPIRRSKALKIKPKCLDCDATEPTTLEPPSTPPPATVPPTPPCDNTPKPNPPCGQNGTTCRPPDHNCPDKPYNPVGKCGHNDDCQCDVIFLPDKDNCDVFYMCSNGKPVQMCCPTDLCFDTNVNVCRPRSPVGECPPKNGPLPTYLPDSDDCHLFYECESGEAIPKECLPELCFDPKLNVCAFPKVIAPLSAVGDCPPRDTNVTVYLPDNANCSIYYVCSNGQAIASSCPPDMSWNNVAHICDWDIDANCDLGNTVRKMKPFAAVGECPEKDGSLPVFLPDDEKNNIYYECSNGVAVQNECPGELIWNSKLNVCVFPSPKTVDVKPFAAVGECPEKDGDFPVYLPDDEKNNIYYECSNGVAIQNECPGELIWNSKLHVCDFPPEKTIKPFAAVGECPEKDGEKPVYLPDDEKNNIYYECSNGVAIPNECPPDLVWNQKLNVCDWDSTVIAPLSAIGTCPQRDGNETVFLADSENCTVYYICSNGRAIAASCTAGMAWNSKLNICDWEIEVECPSARKISPLTAVGECPEKDPANPVYLPDSDSCKIYYECSNGQAIQNECPPDLEFNPTLKVCDNPQDAGCKATGTTAPTEATEPTEPTTEPTTTTQ